MQKMLSLTPLLLSSPPPPLQPIHQEHQAHHENKENQLLQKIIQQREHTFLSPAAIDITTRAWNYENKK